MAAARELVPWRRENARARSPGRAPGRARARASAARADPGRWARPCDGRLHPAAGRRHASGLPSSTRPWSSWPTTRATWTPRPSCGRCRRDGGGERPWRPLRITSTASGTCRTPCRCCSTRCPCERHGGGLEPDSTSHLDRSHRRTAGAFSSSPREPARATARSGACGPAPRFWRPSMGCRSCPIYVSGTLKAMPPGRAGCIAAGSVLSRRHLVQMRFGPAIRPRPDEDPTEVMERVRLLLCGIRRATTTAAEDVAAGESVVPPEPVCAASSSQAAAASSAARSRRGCSSGAIRSWPLRAPTPPRPACRRARRPGGPRGDVLDEDALAAGMKGCDAGLPRGGRSTRTVRRTRRCCCA